jgi:Glycosyl transferase family 2
VTKPSPAVAAAAAARTAVAAPVAAPVADVVLPCLDEAAALPWVLARIPPGWRAIVVDNGSTDGSARIAAESGAYVVSEPVRGFGAACHAGLLAATADVVCFCDCDGSLDPALLTDVAAPVLAGTADLVLARRRPTAFRAWPPHARLANLELARRIRRRTGLPLHDLGPMRAARRTALRALPLTDRRSGYPLQMLVAAADAGWRIEETAVPYTPRTGRSKVTGTWRGTWHAVQDMTAVLHAVPQTEAQVAGAGLDTDEFGHAHAHAHARARARVHADADADADVRRAAASGTTGEALPGGTPGSAGGRRTPAGASGVPGARGDDVSGGVDEAPAGAGSPGRPPGASGAPAPRPSAGTPMPAGPRAAVPR